MILSLAITLVPFAQGRTLPPSGVSTHSANQGWREGIEALERGDNKAAEGFLRKTLEAEPESPGILNDLTIAIARQNRSDEAMVLYQSALRLSPDDPVTKRNLEVACFRAHRYKKAPPYLKVPLKLSPHFSC